MTACPLEHRDDRPHHATRGPLCQPCADRLARDLQALPDLYIELGHALPGTWHDHNGDDTHPLTIAEMPLPLRADIADTRALIRNTLLAWVSTVARHRDEWGPAFSVEDWTRYLADRLPWTLDGRSLAAPLATDLSALVRQARALLDPVRRKRVPAGPCPTHVEGPGEPMPAAYHWPLPCPGTLIVRITGDDAQDPMCDWCGHVTTLDHHAALRRGLAQLVTAQDASVRLGVAVGTIGAWASRGQVERKGKDHRGRTLYALTDLERMADA